MPDPNTVTALPYLNSSPGNLPSSAPSYASPSQGIMDRVKSNGAYYANMASQLPSAQGQSSQGQSSQGQSSPWTQQSNGQYFAPVGSQAFGAVGFQTGPSQMYAGSNTPMYSPAQNAATPLTPSNSTPPAFSFPQYNGASAPSSPNYSATPGFQGGYDQQQSFQQQFGQNFQLAPGQDAVQGQGVTQFGRPISQDPTFADVLNPIYNAPQLNTQVGGGQAFAQGQQALASQNGLSPGIQQVLQNLQSQGNINKAANVSNASSLAAKRGLSGSSIEQFGTSQAAKTSDQATLDSQTAALLQNAQQQASAAQTSAQGYFGQGQQQASLGSATNLAQYQGQLSNNQLSANLTSDELASLRNLQASGNSLALQQYLGTLGISAQNQATGMASQNAQQNSNNQLIGSIAGAIGNAI